MSLEWFDRVTGELQDNLESICDKYDQTGHMSIERGAKHPRIEFYTEIDDELERDYFCTLFFDPSNEEYYMETVDPEYGHLSKVILPDIEDIVDAVHESFHDYMNGDMNEVSYMDNEDYTETDIVVYDSDYDEVENNDQIYEEIDVEWETPEVTAYYEEDEVEVTYQFGVVQETGDGVLRRINRIRTGDDEMLKDETNFIFSKEEAGTIIALIASHLDSMGDTGDYF
ncbi:hypothetical protein BC6307_15010 [Sutcliffiella cohnii]|uniref:Uncharacterized protein n=1 Tax=Sutcliffiella cohnii TaxID=33932 RepID=A0A223KT28_9BACI|nr:hypothetical protein [Sutcliffiella cohnii]AST92508.1 hypothetical protein BC6307_15010 [Sutcliffiella cohnii]